MATVIDALVVTLGLAAGGFTKGVASATKSLSGLNKSSAQNSAAVQKNFKNAADSVKKLRNEALSLLAVFTAGVGIKNFVGNTITSAASLGRMAQNLNLSTKELTAWQRAAVRAGGSAEGITGQLQQSQQAVARFKLGQSDDSITSFFRYGGNVEDLKDGNTFLLARARIVSQLYQTDKARAAVVAQQIGIDQSQFDLIKQGPDAINKLVEAQKKHATITEEDARKSQELLNKFHDLQDSFTAVGTRITIALIPVFERVIGYLEKLADWFNGHSDEIVAALDKFVDGVIKFTTQADKAAQSVGGWQNVLIALAGLKLLSIAAGLARIGVALVSVGGGLAKIAAIPGLTRILGALGLLFHSEDLNTGEDAELAKRREQGATITKDKLPERGTAGEVIRILMGMGWTREQAAGIAANLHHESKFDPEAVGDDGKAYGIAQWHPDRQAEFKRVYGKDIAGSSLVEQLGFLDYELRNGNEQGAGRRLKGAKSAQEAADIVSRYYERPADKEGEAARRSSTADALIKQTAMTNARQTLDLANRAQPGTPGVTNNTGGTTNTVTIDKIDIHTKATDADGIARDMQKSLQRTTTAAMANTGVV